MSPNGQPQGKKKIKAPDNIYTAMLAVACGASIAVAVFVLIQCYRHYGVVFSMP